MIRPDPRSAPFLRAPRLAPRAGGRRRALAALAAAALAAAPGAGLLAGCSGEDRAAETATGRASELPADLPADLPPEVLDRLSPWQKGTPGRWRPARGAAPDAATRERIEALESIGYAGGSRPGDGRTGVVVHRPELAQPGLNFWTSGHAPGAFLMALDGTILHTWECSYDAAFPDDPLEARHVSASYWRRARLFPDGDVVAIFGGLGIVRVDATSNVLWSARNGAHHDFDVAPNGDLWVLTREAHVVPRVSPKSPILEDFVVVLDGGTGEEKRRFSLLECYDRGGAEHPWRLAYDRFWERERERRLSDSDPSDIFHTNSIEILGRGWADRVPGFRAGNLLLSMRNLDAVVVVDPDEERVVWSVSGGFTLQHDPTMTPDGRILVFDNHWRPNTWSRVVAFDPATLVVEWEVGGSDEFPLYSHSCGLAAPLSNGNVLVTETDNGRVLEMRQSGEIVWGFSNPHRAGDAGEYVASIFEMVRLDPDFPIGWAAGAGR